MQENCQDMHKLNQNKSKAWFRGPFFAIRQGNGWGRFSLGWAQLFVEWSPW